MKVLHHHFDANHAHLQLFLIRVYIGIDFIHHFAEKFGLLGIQAQTNVIQYFQGLGYTHPERMVIVAGLCELAAFIGFTFGLCTRLAAVGTTVYLVAALFAGHHELLGFTWANPGGGWEYPTLWAVICLSFILTGGGRWSLDALISKKLSTRASFPLRALFL
jgi:putative oxidoreductase